MGRFLESAGSRETLAWKTGKGEKRYFATNSHEDSNLGQFMQFIPHNDMLRYFLPILKMWKQVQGAWLACPSHRDPARSHTAPWSWVPAVHTGCAASWGQWAEQKAFPTVLAALWFQNQNPDIRLAYPRACVKAAR